MKSPEENTGSKMVEFGKRRIGSLKTAKDVKKFISGVIKRAARGEGQSNDSYKLVMMASMLLKAIELSDFEERIERLEKLTDQG